MATVSNTIDTLYQSILGREADTAGKDYWTSQVRTGALKVEDLETAITTAAAPELERVAQENLISQLELEVQTANDALQTQLAESAQANAALYQDFSSQMAAITAEMNTPKDVSSKVQGLGNVQGGGKTLAEADLDARRGNVDKAYLGARKLQIPLANKGAAKNDVSALNVGSTKGLQI